MIQTSSKLLINNDPMYVPIILRFPNPDKQNLLRASPQIDEIDEAGDQASTEVNKHCPFAWHV